MKGFGVAVVSAVLLSGAASLAVANAGGAPTQGGATGGMGGQPGQPAAGQPAGQPSQPAGQAGSVGQGGSMGQGQPAGGQPQGAPAGGQPPAQGGGQGMGDAPTRQSMDEMVEEAESQAGDPPERLEGAGADAGRFDSDD